MGRILKPVSIISGRLGHSGEELVSEHLAAHLPNSYVILNSPRISYLGEDIDIDHVVIGPNGIFAIESKNMRGKISGGLMGNWMQKSYHTGKLARIKIGNPANQASHYSKIVRQFIKTNFQAKYNFKILLRVYPVVVFAHKKADLRELEFTREGYIGRVRVLKLDELHDYILNTQRDEESIENEIDKIADIIVPITQRDQTGIFTTSLDQLAIPEDDFQEEMINERYLLKEEIGRGSFGAVYKAYDTKLERIVAIKKLYTSLSNDPDIVERFFREARITARLKHENIVSIYDYCEENRDFYLVMEFIEGQTLDKYMQYHVLTEDEIVSFTLDICCALQHAHENQVTHRDLKPSNIIVTPYKKIKVTDFGIASIGDNTNLTQANSSVGTPISMAPEQIKGQVVDKRADIFALGVILYFINTRELPFKGNNIGEVVHKIINVEPELPSKINPNIPVVLEEVIEKALEKHPEDRFQTVQEIGTKITKTYNYHAPYKFTEITLTENQWAKNKRNMGRMWRRLLNRSVHRGLLIFLILAFAFTAMYISTFIYNSGRPSQYNFFINNNINRVLENPGEYAGNRVQLTGKVINKLRGNGRMDIYNIELIPSPLNNKKHILVADTNDVWNNNQTIYFSVGGSIADEDSELTILGENVDIPLIIADRVSMVNDPWDLYDQAKSSLIINKYSQNSSATLLYLDKVEFAQKETRAFVRVYLNPHQVMEYDFKNSFIEYGGKKYKFIPIPQERNYPIIPKQIKSNVIYYGILSFEPLQPNLSSAMKINLINKNPFNGQETFIFEVNNPTKILSKKDFQNTL